MTAKSKGKTALGFVATQEEREVMRALAFLEGRPISDILYEWVREELAAAGQRPDVLAVLERRRQVGVAKPAE